MPMTMCKTSSARRHRNCFSGNKCKKAGDGLVDIYQAKADIEGPDTGLVLRIDDTQPDQPKHNVKDYYKPAPRWSGPCAQVSQNPPDPVRTSRGAKTIST
jgi:hypothetical protein